MGVLGGRGQVELPVLAFDDFNGQHTPLEARRGGVELELTIEFDALPLSRLDREVTGTQPLRHLDRQFVEAVSQRGQLDPVDPDARTGEAQVGP